MRLGKTCLLLLIALTPQIASAGPCFVKMSEVKQNPDAPIHILGYYATITSNALDIAFINTASKPAKTVLWEVRAGDGHGYVRDTGTFAPNVEIHHCAMGYGLHQGNFVWQDQARVRVVRVLYADGSQWSLPDAPPDEADF